MNERDMETATTRTAIPEYWFDKRSTEQPAFWYPDDIPIQSEMDEKYVRLMYVHVGLLEVREIRDDLKRYDELFTKDMAPQFVSWAKALKDGFHGFRTAEEWWRLAYHQVPMIRDLQAPAPEAISEFMKGAAVYQPWVDQWALGSELMKATVSAHCLFRHVTASVGLEWRTLKRNPRSGMSKMLLDFVCLDTENPQLWKSLLSPERQRAEKAMRHLARHELSFYGKNERALLHHAHCWIATRILGYAEDEILPYWDVPNISTKVLRPFDVIFGYHRHPGRPFGTQTRRRTHRDVDDMAEYLKS